MKGNLNQDDKQYFVLSFLPVFLLRTNLVSSLNLPSVLMNAATLKETILDTNPIVKKNCWCDKVPRGHFNVSGNNVEPPRMKEDVPKLWDSLYIQYWTLHLQKELQSKTLNTNLDLQYWRERGITKYWKR